MTRAEFLEFVAAHMASLARALPADGEANITVVIRHPGLIDQQVIVSNESDLGQLKLVVDSYITIRSASEAGSLLNPRTGTLQ